MLDLADLAFFFRFGQFMPDLADLHLIWPISIHKSITELANLSNLADLCPVLQIFYQTD